jgi:hypothetical protein
VLNPRSGRYTEGSRLRQIAASKVWGSRPIGIRKMTRLDRMHCCAALAIVVALILTTDSHAAKKPTDPRIKAPVAKAIALIKSKFSKQRAGYRTLAAYSMVKAGEPLSSPQIVEAITKIKAKCTTSNGYRAEEEHYDIYEAGSDLMLLADVFPEQHRVEIDTIAKHIIGRQMGNGSWTYSHEEGSDTSITQYAMLGLWAAKRTGAEIPIATWDRVARFLVSSQMKDGGFAYQPGTPKGLDGGSSNPNMTAAGTGCLIIARLHIYPDKPEFGSKGDGTSQPKGPSKKFGVLESAAPPDALPANPTEARKSINAIPMGNLDGAINRGLGWLAGRWTGASSNAFTNYYYYGMERVGALSNRETMGSHKWYDECLQILISKQKATGGWDDRLEEEVSAALAVLFMTRSTGAILARPPVGGGLLSGGRGLPDNLTGANVAGGAVKEKKKPEGPLDELLTQLASQDISILEGAQQAIVEKVQIGDRNELLKEMGRVRKLALHPNAEIRRTAVWALGRSRDLRDAGLLIKALKDPEVDVVVEANNALSYLSRKLNGVGVPSSPYEDLADNASEAQQAAALTRWRKDALKGWATWYLRVRPYKDRNDAFELQLRAAVNDR